jgi:hypothetical protein
LLFLYIVFISVLHCSLPSCVVVMLFSSCIIVLLFLSYIIHSHFALFTFVLCYLLSLCVVCRNPTLAKCGGEAQHLEKLEIWSPLELPNVQSSTARPKTPRIEVFLVSL